MFRKSVQVFLSPVLYNPQQGENAIVVVIDILRATTCMCVAFDHGVECIVPVETVEECLAFREKGYLVAAERNGEKIPGFDMGNSPFSFMDTAIQGKKIAMTTTNGTQAIHVARHASEIVIGAFVNMSVVRDYLIEQNKPVVLLCAGWKNGVNLEDTIFAGALVEELAPYFEPKDDAATMARTLYLAADRNKRNYLQCSSHFDRLLKMNLQEDVKYCLHRDRHPVLPTYVNGELRNVVSIPAQPRAILAC